VGKSAGASFWGASEVCPKSISLRPVQGHGAAIDLGRPCPGARQLRTGDAFPKDQFSLAASTGSRHVLGPLRRATRAGAGDARKERLGTSTVRPELSVIWMRITPSLREIPDRRVVDQPRLVVLGDDLELSCSGSDGSTIAW